MALGGESQSWTVACSLIYGCDLERLLNHAFVSLSKTWWSMLARLVLSVAVTWQSESDIVSSRSTSLAGFVPCLLLHILSKWWSLSQWLHLVPKAGHSFLLILVGGFRPCPLVPQCPWVGPSFVAYRSSRALRLSRRVTAGRKLISSLLLLPQQTQGPPLTTCPGSCPPGDPSEFSYLQGPFKNYLVDLSSKPMCLVLLSNNIKYFSVNQIAANIS